MKENREADLVAEFWSEQDKKIDAESSLGSIAPICRNSFMGWLDEHLRHHGELLHR